MSGIMSTVVGARGFGLSVNQQWANAISELLDRHGLTIRGAAVKAQRPSLRTYLADWVKGQVPQYNTAVDFLRHFPRQEAIDCLRAGGFPIPDEWREDVEDELPPDVMIALRGLRLPSSRKAVIESMRRTLKLLEEEEQTSESEQC